MALIKCPECGKNLGGKMRKLICCFFAFCLVAWSSASAEYTTMEGDFSIRDGVKFGMTPEEIKSIEDSSFLEKEAEQEIDGRNYYSVEYSGYLSLAGIKINRGPLGNHSGSIDFRFNPLSRKLERILYHFGYNENLQTFNTLNEIVTEKYGEPIHKNDGLLFPASYISDIPLRWGGNAKVFSYSEWLVKYDAYYVLIDEFAWGQDTPGYCQLEYIYVSNERMAEIAAEYYTEQINNEAEKKHDI